MTAATPRIAIPPTVTEVQSYSFIIRDMFFDKLVAAQFFQGFTARKSRALQIMPNQLPYLGVYFVNEDMGPDGDANAGDIRFVHMLRIGFSVIVVNNDIVVCEAKMDAGFWTIMNTLWRDPYMMNMIDTRAYPGGIGNPDNVRVESVMRGTRRHVFGNAGSSNETPIGEMQYEATVKYTADYPPIITDHLLQIGTRTGIKPGDTPEDMAGRVQVGTETVFEIYPPPEPQPLEQKE